MNYYYLEYRCRIEGVRTGRSRIDYVINCNYNYT